MSFRWQWVLLPAACLLTFWFLSVIEPAYSFNDIARVMHVSNGSEYGKLAVLGCVVVLVCAIARILHRSRDE